MATKLANYPKVLDIMNRREDGSYIMRTVFSLATSCINCTNAGDPHRIDDDRRVQGVQCRVYRKAGKNIYRAVPEVAKIIAPHNAAPRMRHMKACYI